MNFQKRAYYACFTWATLLMWPPPIDAIERPNIVVFFIDDLGYSDLGCYGSTFYETPNIDRLAACGARFTQAYSASPVCSPTRAAWMTGKAPQRLGITQWLHQPTDKQLPAGEITLGEAFTAAGYQTGYIGKWHLGDAPAAQPQQHGFAWQRAVNRAGQPDDYFYPFRGRQQNGVGYWDVPDLEMASDGDYLTDGLTDHALKFIEQYKEEPFLLCLAHYAVHTPIQAPPALVKKYEKKRRDMYGGAASPPQPEGDAAFSKTRQDNPVYAAMVENLDSNVGRILDRLAELHLTDNTVVVFTSDNGGLSTLPEAQQAPTSVRPLRAGKGWTYEGGIRVPAIFVWPHKITPAIVSTPCITMDLYPTLLELAGLPLRPEQHLDGMSLSKRLSGAPDDRFDTRTLVWHYPHSHGSGHRPSMAVRQGDWKLVHHRTSHSNELFNLKNDVGETKNRADEHPGIVMQLLYEGQAQWLYQPVSGASH